MLIGVKMQVVVLVTAFLSVELARSQLWNDPSGGIMVKTLYLPLRKGSSSISLQDLSSARHLTTFNIPFLPVKQSPDLSQASTSNQNYHPRSKLHDSTVQQFQDVRSKPHRYPKSDTHIQVSNYQSPYQGPSHQQQQYNNVVQQPSGISVNQHNYDAQNQVYRPQQSPNQPSVQNGLQQSTYQNIQHYSTGMNNGNSGVQSAPSTYAETNGQNTQNNVNYSEHYYPAHNFVAQKNTAPNVATTQLYSVQSNQYVNIPNQDIVGIPQKQVPTFAGESSKFMRQMQLEISPTHSATVINPPTQRQAYVSNHQLTSFPQPEQVVNQHQGHQVVISNNQYQMPQTQEKTQMLSSAHQHNQQVQQQPVTNTYAIVHQRIPTTSTTAALNNNYISHEMREIEQIQGHNFKQASEGQGLPSHANLGNSGPVEYIKISPLPETSHQMSPPNHLTIEQPMAIPENSQQTPKKDITGDSGNHHSNSFPVAAKVQLVMPQYSPAHDGSPENQYFSQQPSPPGYQVVQNYENKLRAPQRQNSAQMVYPDPTSETFYPENKQIYIAPPPDYTSQVQVQQQQRQPSNEQSFAKYPSFSETNVHYSQIPVSMQTEQLGIHIAIPNRY